MSFNSSNPWHSIPNLVSQPTQPIDFVVVLCSVGDGETAEKIEETIHLQIENTSLISRELIR